MKRICWALTLGLTCAVPFVFAAESFPSKPIRFIVPFPPGGGTDAFARIIGPKLVELLGQQVIVDNRAGAQANIGTAAAAKALANGYTILLAHQVALTINPHLYDNTGYDTLHDFAAVARGTSTAMVLVALAKQNPGRLAFASPASAQQLAGELFKIATNTNLLHVPYKGAGLAVIDLLAGNVVLMFSNPTSVVPHVKAGKLRAIAVLGPSRNNALADVQTAVEAGYPQLASVLEWYGIVVPAATPCDIIARLTTATLSALGSADVAERMSSFGQTISPAEPDEFAKQIREDFERWGKVVQASGAKVD